MGLQIKLFLFAFILIPLLDYIWLGKVMQGFYMNELGSLARMEGGQFRPLIPAAVGVYVCLALALVCFVLSWVGDWPQALGWGALLGFLIYGVYDLTNLSILQSYSLKMTIVDIAWGTVLCGATSAALFFVRGWLQ